MSLWKSVNKGMKAINTIAVEGVGKNVGKVIEKGVKKAPGAINKVAGVADNAIKKSVQVAGKIKDGTVANNISKGAGKISDAVLTDALSYKSIKVGNKGIDWSNKPLIMDQLNSTAKSMGDRGAAIFDTISKDKLNSGRKNPFQLIEKSSDSLVGYKANAKGKLIAGTAMIAAGIPDAGKQYIQNRQGVTYDQQVTTSAPRTPAYANNGGATGDLVFALNNLRHGGMM